MVVTRVTRIEAKRTSKLGNKRMRITTEEKVINQSMRSSPSQKSLCNFAIIAALFSLIAYGHADAHGRHGAAKKSAPQTQLQAPNPNTSNRTGPRWLAGDHHIHSRYSVGFDPKTTPPTPILGGDAVYPITTNAAMARRFGLSWMVATDHGGPNHSKINHDYAYPELLQSRIAVPEVIQFFGLELNTPAADHSSVVIPFGADEAQRLRDIEAMFDAREVFPRDPVRNEEPAMIAALQFMNGQTPKPILFAHHPSRSATGVGAYGLTTPQEFRNWNDIAPQVAIGMEGAPGHQATNLRRPKLGIPPAPDAVATDRGRGAYDKSPTMGGFDQMTARVGGLWDSLLGEGRQWWITATSDSHVHYSEGGIDFWPGEFSKTYVFADKTPASIISGLRSGKIFVTTGDLISELDVSIKAIGASATTSMGGSLTTRRGQSVEVTIRFRDDQGLNANDDNPIVSRVDLIRGDVTGAVTDRAADRNITTRVEARFVPAQWTRKGDYTTIKYVIPNVTKDEYLRVRGTNTNELEPLADPNDENPWTDLWFYSNPLFITPR